MQNVKLQIWKLAGLRLLPSALLSITGGILASTHFHPHHMTAKMTVFTVVGIALYIFFAFSFLHVLTTAFYKTTVRRIGARRASTIRFFLRVIGYLIVLLGLLAILHIPVARILVGSALIGIILSVAAQQSLANFFASVVIIIDRPFSVGQDITIVSGGLGGTYEGTVVDINFSHTMLRLHNDSIVRLPNAPLLSGAAIIDPPKEPKKPVKSK